MSDQPVAQFPRRDQHGRVVSLAELLGASVLGVAVGLGALVVLDAVLMLLGSGRIGGTSGWLALILPVMLYVDEIRAWRGYRVRLVVVIVAVLAGLALGLVAAGLTAALAATVSGGVGAMVAALVYSVVWFRGVRWATGQRGMEQR